MAAHAAPQHADDHHDDIIYPATIPFVLLHLACFGILWTGVSRASLLLCAALYLVRMFGVTAGYHRYFSHRSYRTSRVGQFLLAFLCQTSAQQGILWWASKHRDHHKHADTPEDVHSPRHFGFLFAHVGWIFSVKRGAADYSNISDLTRFPELVWLDRLKYVPPTLLGVACWLALGWQGLFVGFFLSTVILYHCTFAINSLAHVVGKQRYLTGDDSRNNWWLALVTLGEGWHNNHHYYMSSTRQGFRWWEVDPTYYALVALSWAGIVWELRAPPAHVVSGERRAGRAVIEKVARQLADTVPVDAICEQLREAWAHRPDVEELRAKLLSARTQAEAAWAELQLPHLPSVDELRERAQEMFTATPSLDEIAERSRQLVLQAVSVRLFGDADPHASPA
ncbi:MAG: fatty acid desaturase [Gemmatimonadetes bacterium]|nr:fatty acid desaturase [Gemmatimonadota bacterium]